MLKRITFITAVIFIMAIPLIVAASAENDYAESPGSQDIPIYLTGFEPLPAGMEIIYRQYPPRPRRDELVGERFEVGMTWYDLQANGNLSKMIALDEDGDAHIVWTNGFNQDWAACERHVFYNYVVDDEPQLGDDGEGVQVDDLVRGGFTNIGFAPDVGPIPIFHATL
ncbi:MAG: hypothetical protein P9M15_08155, partial [Candidatus Electryoneaceae bacterium]|nr:hypothetical protein [Candidatus Electryoneaceae bacterium]